MKVKNCFHLFLGIFETLKTFSKRSIDKYLHYFKENMSLLFRCFYVSKQTFLDSLHFVHISKHKCQHIQGFQPSCKWQRGIGKLKKPTLQFKI